MNAFLTSSLVRRVTVWTVTFALLLPTLVACTTMPGALRDNDARIDGIVVDGSRLAQAGEAGLATVTRRDGTRQEATAGMVLSPGDRLDTGPRAHAVVRYASGNEVLMRPNSGGRFGSLTEFVGEVFVKVKGIFSVDTTFVKAGARGTAYLVRTYAGATTSVIVVEGTVDVGSTTGAWPTVPIEAGTMTLAHPRAPRPMQADVTELARTRDWVERVEQLAPPPAGVSKAAIIGAIAIGAVIAAILAGKNKTTPSSDGASPNTSTTPAGTRDGPRYPPAPVPSSR